VPATPIALFLREHGDAWRRARETDAPRDALLTDDARRVLDVLSGRGACFFTELRNATSLDDYQLRSAIGILVACGLAVSDGFSGLRALVWASRGRASTDRRATFAGRWTATSQDAVACGSGRKTPGDIDLVSHTLLRRYGVVFRRVLARETNAPPWRDLCRAYRRLEARGEIRGGRFVSGMSSEQFALPEAVSMLREVRRTPHDGQLLVIGTADPLNLVGIVTPGERVRSAGRNRMVYRDGIPLAVMEGEFLRDLSPVDPAIAADVARSLARRRSSSLLRT
jgi:ATP-dependent Lhr-like helicase